MGVIPRCLLGLLQDVVRDRVERALHITDQVLKALDHSRMSTSRQRLVADSGRVSINETRSPTPATPSSSWALTFLVVRMILPYLGCCTRDSSSTTMVFSILSLTT